MYEQCDCCVDLSDIIFNSKFTNLQVRVQRLLQLPQRRARLLQPLQLHRHPQPLHRRQGRRQRLLRPLPLGLRDPLGQPHPAGPPEGELLDQPHTMQYRPPRPAPALAPAGPLTTALPTTKAVAPSPAPQPVTSPWRSWYGQLCHGCRVKLTEELHRRR